MVENQKSDRKLDRRAFLRETATVAGAVLLGADRLLASGVPGPLPGGKFLGLLEFRDEGFGPVATLLSKELDARYYTDLKQLSTDREVTPTAEFYLRTAASPLLPEGKSWKIVVDGLSGDSVALELSQLQNSAKSMGRHLMECAGNHRSTQFGLISVADWSGVSFAELLESLPKRPPEKSRVVIAGFDDYTSQAFTSTPGASWNFQVEALRSAGAFLATGMNGQPLTRNHGAPVRLVVPGWYGCTCIKWVNSIHFVDELQPATSQMQEFAARTLQDGVPQIASEYQPAIIEHAAMPVRVEKWLVNGKVRYRVVGILWGGSQTVKTLAIRFQPEEEFVPVENFHQGRTDPWTMWSHLWAPHEPGTYPIRLAVKDPPVQARKLDSGYYVRTVKIEEV